MAEMTPNDAAFIKVSSELIRRKNDLLTLERLKAMTARLDNWSRSQLKGIRNDTLHSEDYLGLGAIVALIGDDNVDDAITRTKTKIEELTVLAETYIRGGDIVATKLSRV